MMRYGCSLALLLGSTFLQFPSAQGAHPKFDALAALAEVKMRDYHVPGVAIGILDNGTITTRGLGVTNLEDPLPVNDHTVFPIASISKTFAATMMMRLVEQGKVDLQAPVRKYLPEFKVRDDTVSRDVTVWNLLTHTPGWEGQVSGPDRGEDTLRNFVATVMPDLTGSSVKPTAGNDSLMTDASEGPWSGAATKFGPARNAELVAPLRNTFPPCTATPVSVSSPGPPRYVE
jgi:CubicO group peptidase (beta-lactamase class C family)